MNIRIITAAALGAVSLTACSDRDAGSPAAPSADVATDSAATAPAELPAELPETLSPVDPGGTVGPGQTPPTLPTEPSTTSPATSPPPQ
ncbi:hypothetical protein [Brevundimonas sp.]|uniref:hypothetical protein n=1 Tax=Brevundimonas sp. TaxID=1871086 RepID=UPI003F70A697